MCPKRLASPAKQTSRLPGAAIFGAKGRAPEEPRHRRGAAGDSCSAPFLARICHAQRWRITCRPERSPYCLRDYEACYTPSILLRFCSSSSRSSPHGIRPGIKGLTPFSLRVFGRDKNGAERWSHLTFWRRIMSSSMTVQELRCQNVPEAPREPGKTNISPAGRSDLWREGPSTRGATAPQGRSR